MGLLSRIFGRRPRIQPRLAELETGQRVEVVGTVEAIDPIDDPVGGGPAIAIRYRASAPGVASRVVGIEGLDVEMSAYEAVDFVLRDESGAVLVRVKDRGQNVAGFHAAMSDRFGLDLQTEVDTITPGDKVRVWGTVVERMGGSPHRREAYDAILEAERFSEV